MICKESIQLAVVLSIQIQTRNIRLFVCLFVFFHLAYDAFFRTDTA